MQRVSHLFDVVLETWAPACWGWGCSWGSNGVVQRAGFRDMHGSEPDTRSLVYLEWIFPCVACLMHSCRWSSSLRQQVTVQSSCSMASRPVGCDSRRHNLKHRINEDMVGF